MRPDRSGAAAAPEPPDGAPDAAVAVVVRSARITGHRLDPLCRVLTPDEEERARRSSRSSRGLAFALGRVLGRVVVAEAAGVDPMAVAFEADGRGRPHIVASTVPSEMGTGPSSAVAEALDGWSHSVSHSGDVVVVAVAFGAQVGVDVEQAHPDRPWERLARRFFHPDETDRLLAMPVGEAETAFFELWTRKEATLKALGSGLSGRLDSVVPVDLRKRARDFPEPAGTVRWQVQRGVARFEGADVALSDDHRAAVAVAGSLGALDVRRPGDADGPYEALLRQPFKNSSTQR